MRVLYVIDADGLDARCIERFNTCLASLAQQTFADRLVASVADYSTYSVRERIVAPEPLGMEYFHRSIPDPFNKPFCINYAFKRFAIARDPWFFFSDIDLVYPQNFVERFLGRYTSLHPEPCATGMTFYQQARDANYLSDYDTARDTIYLDRRYRGGALMISTSLFSKLRGYDERYFGWGKEDDDFIMRASHEGVFIVDESVEFVHLYHPNKGFVPTINAELLLQRRRDTGAWSDKRTWGDWSSRPTSKSKLEWQLAAGFPSRSARAIVVEAKEGLSVRDLDSEDTLMLDGPGADFWRRCDGDRRFPELVDELAGERGTTRQTLEPRLRAIATHLVSRGFLVIDAERRARTVLSVRLPDGRDAFQRELVRWTIQREADVIEAFDEHSHPFGINIHVDMDGFQGGSGNEEFNVLWTGTYPLDEAYERFDFVVSPRTVVPAFESRSARMPNWLASFSWERADPSRLSPDLLRSPASDPFRPRHYLCVESPTSTAYSRHLLDEMGKLGPVSTVPLSGENSPIDRFELYWQSTFVVIDEPNCPDGFVCDDFVLSILAGAIPIYRGDPLVHLDFNAERFIAYAPGDEDSITAFAAGLPSDREGYVRLLEVPVFHSDGVPYRLTPDRVAALIVQRWKEFASRASIDEDDGFTPRGAIRAL